MNAMISRRHFLSSSAVALAQSPPARHPNFVVICTDDQGSHDLGCYGAKDLLTSSIDSLAASGSTFSNWYANAPVCAPSRAALFTGRYPIRAGVPSNGPALPPAQRTVASLLKPLGYATALTGKWHLGSGPDTDPNAHGFDYFYGFHSGCVDFYSHRFYWGEGGNRGSVNYHDLWRNRTEVFEDGAYLTERITDEACGFIRRNADRPFLLSVTYNAPHYPMHAPQRYLDRLPALELERRTYGAMIAAVDDGVGRIRRALMQHGLLEDTLIFFVADNGATTEARAGLNQKPATAGDNSPYRGFKFSLFDGGMHVPGIMSWPGKIPAGQVIPEVAMTMDITATISMAAGAAPPAGYRLDGSDILPVAMGKARSPHQAIFWEQGKQYAVRKGNWKLVINGILYDRSPEGRKPLEGEDAVFLSDLDADPAESINLRRKHPAVVDELTTLLDGWRKEVRSGS
ncbi:MAG: sulfatase-like hydrolase/transferase [Acidobacteria bacterium]|nr:sulfatase-like hydrolase/transferase [Acidobacteriota bacterium]